MTDFSAIDANFRVETNIQQDGLRFYDALQDPFRIYGVFYENGKFRRMPESVAEETSPGVLRLHTATAGGRIRFQTDSPYVAIHAKMSEISRMSHFPLTGTAGFDMYAAWEGQPERYIGTFIPPKDMEDSYESILHFESVKMREITVNMPLYSGVDMVHIGLQEDATILPPKPYKPIKPIVYYGSSITQGGCASRPGNTYESTICRRLCVDYVSLGFSGNAKGEQTVADYIAGLEMSVFVYDYDYNAPTVEHLWKTHAQMFKTIRKNHPDIPIVMMTRPKVYLNDGEAERREIIRATYQNAKATGDENVYFLTGAELLTDCGNDGSVDGVHPTDFGFASIAHVLGDLVEKLV